MVACGLVAADGASVEVVFCNLVVLCNSIHQYGQDLWQHSYDTVFLLHDYLVLFLRQVQS